MKRKTGFIFGGVVGTTGLICIILATVLGWAVIPNVIEKRIEEQVTLEPGSETWEKWQRNPVPIYFRVYVWNVTNSAEEIRRGVKPILQQVGPYVYREDRIKEQIVTHPENDTIEYYQRIVYVFDQELSGGRSDETQDLNVINTPFIAASMGIYRRAGQLAHDFIDRALVGVAGESLIRTGASVREFMFSGLELHEMYETIIGLLPERPIEFTGNKFAYYNSKNDSREKEKYVVKGGAHDSLEFGKIIELGGKVILDHWRTPDEDTGLVDVEDPDLQSAYCNMINGTDGSIFRPFIKKDTVLRIYQTEICRSLHVTYVEDAEHLDIPGYKFTMPSDFYDWPEDNPNNWCFCNSPQFTQGFPLDRNCSKGVIRLGPCKHGSPVVTSNPHFLYSNEDYYNYVDGDLTSGTADPERHRTTIVVEPNSGSMLWIAKRLQINVELQRLHTVEYFQDLPHFMFPAFWVEEYVELDDFYADDLKSKLITPLKKIKILKWTVLGVGCFLIGLAAAAFIVVIRKRK